MTPEYRAILEERLWCYLRERFPANEQMAVYWRSHRLPDPAISALALAQCAHHFKLCDYLVVVAERDWQAQLERNDRKRRQSLPLFEEEVPREDQPRSIPKSDDEK